ncbi:MAG: hypothetical protein JW888_15735, partial [Pirellulales bacterium]|nr:hypothetical protein [Pirellulales bacterium]
PVEVEKKSEPLPPAETAPSEAKTPEKPAPELPTLTLPELSPSVPDEPKAEKADPVSPTAPAVESAPKPEFQPLDEAKDSIRRTLSQQKASERMVKALATIQSKMNKHRKVIIAHEMDESNKDKPAPKLNVASLAKAVQLNYYPTGLITEAEFVECDLGQSSVEGRGLLVVDMFGSMPLFLPGIATDNDQNKYLYWKIEEVEERIPEFDDEGMREQVLAAWKFVEARKLAQQHAEKLADTARKSGKSLRGSIGTESGVDVAETGRFSWVTQGTQPAMQSRSPLRISEVKNVEMPGNDFMQAVYGLNVGEIGTAMNEPQSIVYVVRLVETTPREKVLRSLFEIDDYSKYWTVGGTDIRTMIDRWSEELHKDAGLKWERPPERMKQR